MDHSIDRREVLEEELKKILRYEEDNDKNLYKLAILLRFN